MTDTSTETAYRVLARKYRPETFADLIGQEAMVRTLRNAFEADRIAHAFVLTGVRGVGKTTTARIVAKGLNCTGKDGNGGPTITPCGECETCVAISEGRHVDVLEMDAASRTGVGDIREIIDSVAYSATSARYKVYIIDEVHMLSTSAFNALLKTLEEPPAHVKFIFATTEIRKVPVTVLSRCQRFDLRRIEPDQMIGLLEKIATSEKANITREALELIVRAAEGSARDATSLLDQAIAHGGGETGVDQVRAMMGLADRGRILDLFEHVMTGDVKAALDELGSQYASGADPLAVLRDLSEVTHWVSMILITPEAAEDPTIGPDERARGLQFADKLTIPKLTRMWQMLLKAMDEVTAAPNAMMAAEMAIIRLTHVAELPSPEALIRRLTRDPAPGGGGPGGGGGRATEGPSGNGATAGAAVQARPVQQPQPAPIQAAQTQNVEALARFAEFEDVVALVRANRDMQLLVQIEDGVKLVSYSPGRIEFEPADGAAPDLAARIGQKMSQWTGVRWVVSVVGQGGAPSIREKRDSEEANLMSQVRSHPLVSAVLEAFPGASISAIRAHGADGVADAGNAPGAAADDSIDVDDDDDWDPFDPFSEED